MAQRGPEDKGSKTIDHKRSASLVASFRCAFHGISQAVTSQRNMRIHLLIAVLAILAGLILRLTASEWFAILLLIGAVLAFEMLNTAIETLTDLVSPHYHPLAKDAKDIAAGTVLVMAVTAVICGLIVYFNAFSRLIG